LGEFVDPDVEREPARRDPNEPPTSGGWVVSSFELRHGADVTEGHDTVPAELFDELFARPAPPQKPSEPG
jgi:hypothetical protein